MIKEIPNRYRGWPDADRAYYFVSGNLGCQFFAYISSLQMRNSPFFLTIISLVLLFIPLTSHAQNHHLKGGVGYGIVGSGDHRIPSAHLGYARQILSHLDATAHLRFSRTRRWKPLDPSPGVPHDLSYLDGSIGLLLHPIDSKHHRLDLGIGGAMRGRWETRTIELKRLYVDGQPTYVDGQPTEVIAHNTERRTSADTGFFLRAGYSYRLSQSFWIGGHMNGYTYQEGTSLFLFTLSVDYQF